MNRLDIADPGCTIGSCADTDLPLLAEANPIGRIQAIVRTRDGNYTIQNMSAVGSVSINGRPLELRQVTSILPGDAFNIGGYTLTLDDEITAPQQDADEQQSDIRDVFKNLLGGPGAIPVGASTPALHSYGAPDDILTDTRPTILNRVDPLATQEDDISDVLGPAFLEKTYSQKNS